MISECCWQLPLCRKLPSLMCHLWYRLLAMFPLPIGELCYKSQTDTKIMQSREPKEKQQQQLHRAGLTERLAAEPFPLQLPSCKLNVGQTLRISSQTLGLLACGPALGSFVAGSVPIQQCMPLACSPSRPCPVEVGLTLNQCQALA